jgi:glyoxylase-like metal-dependent hydrolase (beta-lactamase superfamily II)
MRFRKAGKIMDRFWYLGREESGVYYIEGRDGALLINGGMSSILPDVIGQMKAFGLDPTAIKNILVLHSHFDHVGIVPHFKRTCPAVELLASAAAWEILARPKAIEIINRFNHQCADRAGATESLAPHFTDWGEDITGTGVGEGDTIDLGGITLQVIDTPGHSQCSISVYEPDMKVLFASDAVGIPFKDSLFPSMNTNVDQYLQSLEKLKSLPVSIVCCDHCGYVTGEEAGYFVQSTIEEGIKWRNILKDYCRRFNGDVDAAGKAVTDFFYEQMPAYFIAADILEGVFRQMVKYVARISEGRS